MMGWHDGWGPGTWALVMLMMVVFWAAVVFAVAAFARSQHPGPPAAGGPSGDQAMRILDERLARGEIDADEYAQRRDLLRTR